MTGSSETSKTAEAAPAGARALLSFFHMICARPVTALVLAVLAVTALSIGSASLTFRSDERVFFDQSNDKLQQLYAFEARYGKDDNAIVLVHVPNGTIFQPEHLNALRTISDDLWSLPMARRVESPVNFQVAIGEGEEIIIDQLWRAGDDTTPEHLQRMQGWAEQTPLMMGRMLSYDMSTALAVISFSVPPEQADSAPDVLMAAVRERVASYREAYPELEIRLSGSVALDAAFGEASASDGAFLVPVMFVALLGLLWLILGSVTPVLAATLIIGGSIGAALGLGGFFGLPLSSVSVASPFIITIIALADVVHFSSAAFQHDALYGAGDSGRTRRIAAVQAAFKKTAWPIFLTSATTAVGFFSLVFSEAPPFRHLGIFSGVGTIIAMLLSFLILPAILILLPWHGSQRIEGFREWFLKLGYWVVDHARPAVVITVAVSAVLSGLAFTNKLDDRYIQYFDQRFEFRQDTDRLNELIGGFYVVEYDLLALDGNGIAEPEYLRQVDQFSEYLRVQPGVTHVASHADRIKMVNRAFGGGALDTFVIPDKAGVAAQLHEMYEMQLPYGMNLSSQVMVDRSASRMTVALQDLSTGEVLTLVENAQQWAQNNTPMLADSAVSTGSTVMFSYIGQRNIDNMVLGTAVAFCVIMLMLLLVVRSFKVTLIAMVANVAPALIALGAWSLTVGEVGMAVATIVATTLGVAVDDTIHLLTALRRRLAEHEDPREAIAQALGDAGPGMAMTTVCLVVGFGVLALSGFQINAWLGLMTAIVAVVALVFDLIFLPAVLLLLNNNK